LKALLLGKKKFCKKEGRCALRRLGENQKNQEFRIQQGKRKAKNLEDIQQLLPSPQKHKSLPTKKLCRQKRKFLRIYLVNQPKYIKMNKLKHTKSTYKGTIRKQS
jgi:hypothetical protein